MPIHALRHRERTHSVVSRPAVPIVYLLLLCTGRAVEGDTHAFFAAVCWQLCPSAYSSQQDSAESDLGGYGVEILKINTAHRVLEAAKMDHSPPEQRGAKGPGN